MISKGFRYFVWFVNGNNNPLLGESATVSINCHGVGMISILGWTHHWCHEKVGQNRLSTTRQNVITQRTLYRKSSLPYTFSLVFHTGQITAKFMDACAWVVASLRPYWLWQGRHAVHGWTLLRSSSLRYQGDLTLQQETLSKIFPFI